MTSHDGVTQRAATAPSGGGASGGVISTSSVPAAERLDFWREVVCHSIAGVEASALAKDHPYDGLIRSRTIPVAHMPSFDLLNVKADPQRVRRTQKLISGQSDECWLLMVQNEGTCLVTQGDKRNSMLPGDIGFLDTARPYDVLFPGTFNQGILRMPKRLFRDALSGQRDLSAIVLSGSNPLTAIARHNLALLDQFASDIAPGILPIAAERAMDHLALAIRGSLAGDDPFARQDFSALHFEHARSYLARHLGDPALSVERIARATGLSSGHLQSVFRARSGQSVAEYVRDQRLAACRRDLDDPVLANESITSIAFRWGFSEASSFSRAFRTAFQTSPRSYRRGQ